MEHYFPTTLTEADLSQMESAELVAAAKRTLLIREFNASMAHARMAASGKATDADKVTEAVLAWLAAMPDHYRIRDIASALSLE